MKPTLTRRELGGLVAAAAPALAQAPPKPAPAVPKSDQEELEAQLEQSRNSQKQLASFQVPMATEPSFQFKP